jgi:hypothetical protein
MVTNGYSFSIESRGVLCVSFMFFLTWSRRSQSARRIQKVHKANFKHKLACYLKELVRFW